MKARLLVACVLLGCAEGAEAPLQTNTRSTPDASVAAPSTAARSSEPAVGVAPADAMKKLRHSLSHSLKNVNIERRSGRLHIDVAGSFQTASIITFDKEGRASKRCLDSAADLDRMMGESP